MLKIIPSPHNRARGTSKIMTIDTPLQSPYYGSLERTPNTQKNSQTLKVGKVKEQTVEQSERIADRIADKIANKMQIRI